MKIGHEQWRLCKACGHREERISEDTYGCDNCRKPISVEINNKRHNDYLQATVFSNSASSESEHLEFCSWECALKKLREVKSDYFITLPYLQYEKDCVPGQSAADFFKAIGEKP